MRILYQSGLFRATKAKLNRKQSQHLKTVLEQLQQNSELGSPNLTDPAFYDYRYSDACGQMQISYKLDDDNFYALVLATLSIKI